MTAELMQSTLRSDSILNDNSLEADSQLIDRLLSTIIREIDAEAVYLSGRYRTLALLSSISGCLAVLFAILQLFIGEHHGILNWLFSLEAIAAFFALVTVVYGIGRSIHHRWLVKRHQVERLRMLHAEALIRITMSPIKEEQLINRVKIVRQINFSDMKAWIGIEHSPSLLESYSANESSDISASKFREIYANLRLQAQSNYLRSAGKRHDRLDTATKHLVPFLFFASVACVAVHSVFHLLHGELSSKIAHIFLLLAACLPVVATGLRTYREAVQVSRNAARLASKAAILELLQLQFANVESLNSALLLACKVEQVLESEHREWLRLMLDAEWFA